MASKKSRKHAVCHLGDAFAIVGISVENRQPLTAIVVAPLLLVLLTNHVSPVHDQQARLVEAPDWDLGMTGGQGYPAENHDLTQNPYDHHAAKTCSVIPGRYCFSCTVLQSVISASQHWQWGLPRESLCV